MRPSWTVLWVLLVCGGVAAQTQVVTTLADESVFITRKRVVLVRTGALAKRFPEKRRAVVI